ncbi:hypothetical protein M3M35_07325 [Fructilactobacillus myrtifloralis]|uniref:Uncharacterized protein n=1 Tax=Fructilactobacillus myrtifloralis TaxID=2940301 RepID=A0ABY5BN45_9LACO|nr:hypothetical protein [Fructilactobacillus myrtifloralis]USS85093.1 hypothetical protein M3M35_07325 [Fructilactobacillus myrtifloralis]
MKMSNFDIVALTSGQDDGTNQQHQVMPQTTPEAVIGLKKWMDNVDKTLERFTGKDANGNASNLLTKSDLTNFATKAYVDDAKTSAKQYADVISQKIKNFGVQKVKDKTDANDLTKFGIYVKTMYETLSNLPPYDTINKTGALIVIPSDTIIYQKWISFDLQWYEYARSVQNKPNARWALWAYKAY